MKSFYESGTPETGLSSFSAGLWLRLQVAFDLWRTEQDLQKELARIPDRSQAA
jgi:plasmid maintenance system antidote protein VapI